MDPEPRAPPGFDWVAERQVGAMGMPWPEDYAALRALGVTALLSLSERVPHGAEGAGLELLHLPVRDYHAPTGGQLDAAVEFIERTLGRGGACTVHCGAGLGRTGTVLAAWLVRRGRAPDEAIREVRALRPGSVETPEQEQAVAAYARSMRGRTGP